MPKITLVNIPEHETDSYFISQRARIMWLLNNIDPDSRESAKTFHDSIWLPRIGSEYDYDQWVNQIKAYITIDEDGCTVPPINVDGYDRDIKNLINLESAILLVALDNLHRIRANVGSLYGKIR